MSSNLNGITHQQFIGISFPWGIADYMLRMYGFVKVEMNFYHYEYFYFGCVCYLIMSGSFEDYRPMN
jgi:hypothetical protein